MTMEEILAVVQKIKDAWVAFGQSMAEAAQALEDMFRNLGESDELWPKRNGIPPKKYGMSLHRRVRPAPPRYQFVPVAPRTRPYQRRAF
ncbi:MULTISPECIES: hypothetical protein [Flavonifractor]|jgi:hypothetical protein|uniref:hypothetical protein n=1 Tax=Flavonifractor TaxID=946234 RepID=UPI00189767B1|nr:MULTISPECIES: hypothetical protein [Flavonifractor]MBS6216382.1 hypothetical protein [Clostridiales bacterium]MCG4705034.1 hypothetical protein [Flavonifractor plautii]MCQ5029356.1 hypothetical protein [Flavonifractor sp. DFI.6.63]UBS61634.1 hypothetical protein LCR02_01560 [Flavonifractor plautii]